MVAEWDEKGPITGVGGKKFRKKVVVPSPIIPKKTKRIKKKGKNVQQRLKTTPTTTKTNLFKRIKSKLYRLWKR